MRWLKKEVTGKQFFLCVGVFLIVGLLYAFGCLEVANLFKVDIPPIAGKKIPILTLSFPFLLFATGFLEELMFRLPLAIFIGKGWKLSKILVIALVLSVLFGLIHGSVYHVFVQGVIGFMFCILFLKCGGLQEDYEKAFWTTTITHFLFNAVIIVVGLAQGITEF